MAYTVLLTPTVSASATPDPLDLDAALERDPLWERITEDFRMACLMRREGRLDEAERILGGRLPSAIGEWSRANPRDVTSKKSELLAMFKQEQQRIQTALTLQKVVTSKIESEVLPSFRSEMAEQVKVLLSEEISAIKEQLARAAAAAKGLAVSVPETEPVKRVKFDDIPAVIDAILADQQGDTLSQPAFQTAT